MAYGIDYTQLGIPGENRIYGIPGEFQEAGRRPRGLGYNADAARQRGGPGGKCLVGGGDTLVIGPAQSSLDLGVIAVAVYDNEKA